MRYEWHLRADLRFDQHILAFYRAGSDRRIIAGYSAFRHGTRIGRSRIQRIGRRYRRQVGRILRAMQAQQQIAHRCGRAQHDGGHCDQSHTGYGPRTLIGRIQANQCFTRGFTLSIPFRPASIKWLPIVFHNMFHTSYVASSKPHRPPCTGHNQQSRISLRRDQHASEQR